MNITLLTMAAALAMAFTAPAFADSMQRDGGPTGKNNGIQLSQPQRSWDRGNARAFYTGRSIAHDQRVYDDSNSDY